MSEDILTPRLGESQSLAAAREVVQHAIDTKSDVQAASMVLLVSHIDKVDAKLEGLRSGQLATQEILAAQNNILAQHGQALADGKATMERIDATTSETNGKVKKLRSEYDATKEDVCVVMKERKDKIISEEEDRLRREGMLVIPRRIGIFLKICWKYFGVALKWLGAIGIAWPALQWLWDRFHH